MVDADNDIPCADDAIPADAISLTDAYDHVVDLICDHPELLPKFDDDWAEALLRSREEEGKMQVDKEAFDNELEEFVHHRKEANLFLRLEIEAKKLVAYTRDPETGDILQLRSDGWTADGWDEYIPSGIWDDYITDDYDDPGPKEQTVIRGFFRRVFFRRHEFEICVRQAFGETVSILAMPLAQQKHQNFDHFRAHVLAATKNAILTAYGENGPPPGVTEGLRFNRINALLKERNLAPSSKATIRRALRELRLTRSRIRPRS